MTIFQLFINTLRESQEINCLRSWAWENGIYYNDAHKALRRAKELYPGQVHITRQTNQQGRPLIVRWVG